MKIEHLAIWVNDLQLMKTFYCNYFNATANTLYQNQQKGFSSYFISFPNGGPRLELMQQTNIPNSRNDVYLQYKGLIHFAIAVGSKEKVDHMTQLFLEHGFEVLDGPRYTGDGYYESVILDPEKNRIEITI